MMCRRNKTLQTDSNWVVVSCCFLNDIYSQSIGVVSEGSERRYQYEDGGMSEVAFSKQDVVFFTS